MAAPLPPGRTRRTDWLRCSGDPCVCQHEKPRTADDILGDLLALVAVFEAKQPAHRYIPARIVREFITGERAR